MANLITSVESIEATEYELYLKPLLDDPQVQSLPFNISYGNMPKELHFNTNLDKVLRAKTDCGWSFVAGSGFTKKTLNQAEVQAAISQCYSVMLKKLFGNNLPDGYQRGELSTEITSYMTEQQQYAFNRDILSIILLGDTALNDSPAYYDILNGIFTKLKAGAAAADGTIDAADSSITLDATSLNTTNFYATMKSVYDLQPRALKRIPKNQKAWIWTEALYEKYQEYLLTKTQINAGAIETGYVVGGVDAATFLGVPIVVLPIIDERLETDFLSGSPAEPTDPYRCILTWPKNHIIHLDGNGLTQGEMWYEKKDDMVYLTGSALIAYEYGYGDLNVFAGLS